MGFGDWRDQAFRVCEIGASVFEVSMVALTVRDSEEAVHGSKTAANHGSAFTDSLLFRPAKHLFLNDTVRDLLTSKPLRGLPSSLERLCD